MFLKIKACLEHQQLYLLENLWLHPTLMPPPNLQPKEEQPLSKYQQEWFLRGPLTSQHLQVLHQLLVVSLVLPESSPHPFHIFHFTCFTILQCLWNIMFVTIK